MFEYAGNIHIHSQYSDGSGTIPFIAEQAVKVGLDFVIITDHHTLKGLQQGEEGYYGSALALIGMEINRVKHHYLALGITSPIDGDDSNPQAVVDKVKAQGGLGFIAHPFEQGSKLSQDTYRWDDWHVDGFTGICLWNYCSQWREGLSNPLSALYLAYFNPNAAVLGPDAAVLSTWDKLCEHSPVVGIGGSDAHAMNVSYGPFRPVIFPYEFLFRTINTHVLLPNQLQRQTAADKRAILAALAAGHCFIGFDYYQNTRGFRFSGANNAASVIMGDRIQLCEGVELAVELPVPAKIKLLCSGTQIKAASGQSLKLSVHEPGAYRVQVDAVQGGRERTWIVSNPIYIDK